MAARTSKVEVDLDTGRMFYMQGKRRVYVPVSSTVGGGGISPFNAYVTWLSEPLLSGSRYLVDGDHVTWETTIPGEIKPELGGLAGGDLDGDYPDPEVVAVTDAGALRWPIGTITEGKSLIASGGVITTGTWAPDWKTWDVGKTTSLTAGEEAGPTWSLVAGKYFVLISGSASSTGAATGPRPFIYDGGGALVTSDVRTIVSYMSAATTMLSAELNNVTGTVPLINQGSTTASAFFIMGTVVVTTPGDMELWIATETGGTNVTLHQACGFVQRVS